MDVYSTKIEILHLNKIKRNNNKIELKVNTKQQRKTKQANIFLVYSTQIEISNLNQMKLNTTKIE